MRLPIEFKRDGLTIRGHVWGNTGKHQPAVILCHGFMANEKMCADYAELLTELSCVAVTFDFCGGGIGGKSDGNSRDMTILSEKADLMAVIKGVKEQFTTTGISLLGCSQGGLVAGLTAAELGAENIASLMLFYPAVCIPDDARKGKMMFARFDPKNIPDQLSRFPMALGGDYARTVMDMDPYQAMSGYTGPVLLLHGTEDKVVDISYSKALRNIYPDCRYEEIEGGGHMFRGKADVRAREILYDFMSSQDIRRIPAPPWDLGTL